MTDATPQDTESAETEADTSKEVTRTGAPFDSVIPPLADNMVMQREDGRIPTIRDASFLKGQEDEADTVERIPAPIDPRDAKAEEELQQRAINILVPARYEGIDHGTIYQRDARTDAIRFLDTPEDMEIIYQKFDVLTNCKIYRVVAESFNIVPDGVVPPTYIYTHLSRKQAEKRL